MFYNIAMFLTLRHVQGTPFADADFFANNFNNMESALMVCFELLVNFLFKKRCTHHSSLALGRVLCVHFSLFVLLVHVLNIILTSRPNFWLYSNATAKLEQNPQPQMYIQEHAHANADTLFYRGLDTYRSGDFVDGK